jgi:hypothetical protein
MRVEWGPERRNTMYPLEKRNHKRLPVRLVANVQVPTGRLTTHTIDVSEGGALLDSPLHLNSGSEVEVKIRSDLASLPPTRAIVKRCKPAFWNRRFTVALQFAQEEPAVTDLAKLVDQHRQARSRRPVG